MKRDHNAEAAALPRLSFDLQMHDYMMDSFRPWFVGPMALELGCFMGDSTHAILQHDFAVTVVEAASECIRIAKERLADDAVRFVHADFETADLDGETFDAIFCMHVLEHLNDPIAVLKRCKEWLDSSGRLFLAVPNANAASRQLAVAMGLIPCNQAITEAEFAHGHRATYSLDTLERDARAAGLSVLHCGGIFFKAMSGAQFDKALAAGIIDSAYMDACFKLGHRYPDLCSTVFLVCGKGA